MNEILKNSLSEEKRSALDVAQYAFHPGLFPIGLVDVIVLSLI
jgi:hypothetical protein